MNANVRLVLRRNGKIAAVREGHNTWVGNGRIYLAEIMALLSMDPDIPERTERLKYVGLGIGGVGQNLPLFADNPPFSTSYPAGSDPNASNGHQYNDRFPISPPITTLERPVRLSGGTTAYPGAPTDVWLTGPPLTVLPPNRVLISRPSPSEIRFFIILAGVYIYGPFTTMPFSEIGLFLNSASVNGDPFSTKLTAYHTFDTILYDGTTQLFIYWTVRF